MLAFASFFRPQLKCPLFRETFLDILSLQAKCLTPHLSGQDLNILLVSCLLPLAYIPKLLVGLCRVLYHMPNI